MTAKPIREGILDLGPPPRLLGGYCPDCHRKHFPKPMVCPFCLGGIDDIQLSATGKLYSFAVVRTKAPYGLPQPYPVGYVDLDGDGLRIFSLLDPERIDRLTIGQRVALCVAPIGVDNSGQSCLRYYFTPQEGEKSCDR